MQMIQAALGLAVFILIAWLLSENRRVFNWRLVLIGLSAQCALAFLFLQVPAVMGGLWYLNGLIDMLSRATLQGTTFLFGYLGGGPLPFDVREEAQVFILAFQVLPQILVFSVILAILWHWGILQLLIRAVAALLHRLMGIGGPLGLAASASIFIGMVEAPMAIKPHLVRLSRSDFFAMTTCGMATVAGTIMALYASILRDVIENPIGHVLIASVISVPAALLIARVMVPGKSAEDEEGKGFDDSQHALSLMDAVTKGAQDGLQIMLSVIAMLLALVALVALVNEFLLLLPPVAGAPLTLDRALGWAFSPIAWLMGVPWGQAPTAGYLLGVKVILTELLAYIRLADLPPDVLDPRSRVIMTYALSGFANFASMGIMLGGISVLCPSRRVELLELVPKTLVSGTLATCMTGAVVGLLSWGL